VSTNFVSRAGFILGLSAFASGIGYYLMFRSWLPWPLHLFDLSGLATFHTDLTRGTYPSFIFALSMGFIAVSLFSHNRLTAIKAILGIWFVGVTHECFLGTFDSNDLLAGSLGVILPLLFAVLLPNAKPINRGSKSETWKMLSLMSVSVVFATGTSYVDPHSNRDCVEFDTNGVCIERSVRGTPVYMSYEVLRSAVKMSPAREMKNVSRIYWYNSILFINEKNEGIHVIDNSFPASPKQIGFIEIPGNTEINIREDNLYADSYIDLVTIDVSNLPTIREIAREEKIFPYNARQNIPNNVEFARSTRIDQARGVVVGWR